MSKHFSKDFLVTRKIKCSTSHHPLGNTSQTSVLHAPLLVSLTGKTDVGDCCKNGLMGLCPMLGGGGRRKEGSDLGRVIIAKKG